MTDIEKKALALANEVAGEAHGLPKYTAIVRSQDTRLEALCRAIEQHEAFRQEVSDAVEKHLCTTASSIQIADVTRENLARFIIAKPVDPFLIEAREVCARVEEERNNPVWATRYRSGQYDELGWVKHIRAALAARGLEVRKIGEGE